MNVRSVLSLSFVALCLVFFTLVWCRRDDGSQFDLEPSKLENPSVEVDTVSGLNRVGRRVSEEYAEPEVFDGGLQSSDDSKQAEAGLDVKNRGLMVVAWEQGRVRLDPSDVSYEADSSGPFGVEVNIEVDDACIELCAEVLTQRIPSDGKYADQVNEEALQGLVSQDGSIEVPRSIPLLDQRNMDSAPPVGRGIWE